MERMEGTRVRERERMGDKCVACDGDWVAISYP